MQNIQLQPVIYDSPFVYLASTDALVSSIIGQSTGTSLSAKAAADAMAAKTAGDAARMGDITRQLSIQRTMESRQ